MPYHVIIQSSGSATPILRTDLTADELRTRFLQPYAEGIPLVVDGSTISLQSLRQIKVYESEGPIALVIEAAQQSDDERSVAHLGDLRHRAVELSRDVTEQFITCPPGSGNRVTAPSMPEPPKNSVFLVHGRNHRVNQALRDFLRAVGLQVVEWTHAVAQTGIPLPMTSDIVDQGFAMSHATVVLMTPDDLVQIHPDLSSPTEEKCPLGQPRPNVLFEAGMAWAMNRRRTVIVEVGPLRGLTDLDGVHVVRLDNRVESRMDLVQRLKSCGCELDELGRDWLSAGDFDQVNASFAADSEDAGMDEDPGKAVSLRIDLLSRLKVAAVSEAATGMVGQLDMDSLSAELGLSADVVQAELAEMLVDGLIEPHVQTLGKSAAKGACRITKEGLEELQSVTKR